MTKSREKRIIEEFIDHYFRTRKNQYNKHEIRDYDQLISIGILCETNDGLETFKIQEYSIALQEVVLEIATNKLRKELPRDISSAIEFAKEFDRTIKLEYNCQRINNPFAPLLRGLIGYILYILKKQGADTKSFLLSLKITKRQDDHYSIVRCFFGFLPSSNYSEKDIVEILSKFWNIEKTRMDVITGLRNLPNKNVELSNLLLEYVNKNNDPAYLMTDLLIGLYNSGDTMPLEKLLNFLQRDREVRLAVLGRINFKRSQDVHKTFDQIKELEFADLSIVNQQSYAIRNVIECSLTDDSMRSSAFDLYKNLLLSGTVEIAKIVMNDIYHLEGYESEKYGLLLLYLSKTGDFGLIRNYFSHYENPIFVFDLMMRLFRAKPEVQFSIEMFHDGIRNGWKNFPLETEQQILYLFKQHAVFGILGVKVILSIPQGTKRVDLLKLEKGEYQLNAINNICKYPHSFDKLIPLLLPLRNSKHRNVREHLQESLAQVVFNTYHSRIFNLIKKSIGTSKRDQIFLKPIKDALESYYKLKELKESINDLNPFENERDLMDLYYRTESEEHAKRMNEIYSDKGTFLEGVKNEIIVRGNSWMIRDGEVSALTVYEHNILIDGSSYLNPDLYEFNMNNLL